MIQRVVVKNLGCVRDAEVRLTPLHALIGPNDSGKSTLLRALEAAVGIAARSPRRPMRPTSLQMFQPVASGEASVTLDLGGVSFAIVRRQNALSELLLREDGSQISGGAFSGSSGPSPVLLQGADECLLATKALQGVRLLRLDPDAVRQSSALIPDGNAVDYDERGVGLPGVYDAIVNRGDDSFQRIAREVCRLFPTVKALRLKAVSQSNKEFEIELVDGRKVAANQMSEGLLYYLGFAVLPYLEPTSLVLVEEPENGLHPSRISDVVRVFREVVREGTQVVVATHSPLVINEMHPEEVSVVTRAVEDGTRATPIADTPGFGDRSRVYALGELWLAYANGDDEAPLLKGEGPAR